MMNIFGLVIITKREARQIFAIADYMQEGDEWGHTRKNLRFIRSVFYRAEWARPSESFRIFWGFANKNRWHRRPLKEDEYRKPIEKQPGALPIGNNE